MIRHNMSRWCVDHRFGARIEHAADDLVGHAVATTGVTLAAPLYAEAFDELDIIVVRLSESAGRVTLEVWDRGNQPPLPALLRSASLACADGWDFALPHRGLRVIWCVLTPDSGPSPSRLSPPLPRRPQSRHRRADDSPSPAPGPQHDTALLLRVIQGIDRIGQ